MTIEEKAKAYDKALERANDMISYKEVRQEDMEYLFPELKESEDNDVRKAIIALIEFGLEDGSAIAPGFNVTKEQALAWIEKQGEQKPFNYEHVNIQQKDFALVEPKFKVDDWIIDNEYGEVLKVTKADANSYEITRQDGEVFDILKEDVECNYRLWTITDAKDGDVLVAQPEIGSESNEQIFLFKAINSRDYVDNCIEYYGRLCDDRFYKNTTGYMGTTLDTFYPATKEQRDLLFQKMADAGYEFVNGHI